MAVEQLRRHLVEARRRRSRAGPPGPGGRDRAPSSSGAVGGELPQIGDRASHRTVRGGVRLLLRSTTSTSSAVTTSRSIWPTIARPPTTPQIGCSARLPGPNTAASSGLASRSSTLSGKLGAALRRQSPARDRPAGARPPPARCSGASSGSSCSRRCTRRPRWNRRRPSAPVGELGRRRPPRLRGRQRLQRRGLARRAGASPRPAGRDREPVQPGARCQCGTAATPRRRRSAVTPSARSIRSTSSWLRSARRTSSCQRLLVVRCLVGRLAAGRAAAASR